MKWFALLIVFSATGAQAFDTPYFARSPTGLLMGDAFTAVNDDEYTLFYNPASLGRHKADFTFTPLNPQINGTNILSNMDKFEDFPDDAVGVSDRLMDFPAHAAVGVAPGFKIFNVGVSFLASESYDVMVRNDTHPMMDLDARSDRGVLFGVGVPLGSSRINGKNKSGMQTSIGLGAKYIERTGVRDTMAVAGPTVVSALGQDELSDLVKTLGRVKSTGWGFDAGIEHAYRNGGSQFVIGLAAMDVTGTEFKEAKNVEEIQVADNRDQVNLGMAVGQDFGLLHWIASADIRALNEQMDFGKRVRLGAQIGLPGLRFMGGINSGYYSYGATLDLKLFRVTGGFYDVELGSKYKQIKAERFVIYLSLFDFSFDA